jgi:hypothetical protein
MQKIARQQVPSEHCFVLKTGSYITDAVYFGQPITLELQFQLNFGYSNEVQKVGKTCE